jgi:hypothetical protein
MSNKTIPTPVDPVEFVSLLENEKRKQDAEKLLTIFNSVTGMQPVMWGGSMIGYGSYDYTYDSGRSGTFFRVGFSPRKQNLSLHLLPDVNAFDELLSKLGKFKTGRSCLYINKLEDIDEQVLEKLIAASLNKMNELYPAQ